MPCVEREYMPNVTSIEVAQQEAESKLFPCSERPIEMTVSHIMTGRQMLKLLWPKAMSQNASRSPCLK